MKTTTAKKIREIKTIDAAGRTLGRVASEVAVTLLGKTKATFERHKYSGMPVVVINVSKIKITPKKLEEIYHTRYSGIPGGLRILSGTYTKDTKGMKELVRLATYQMLPGNKLRRVMMKNLTIEE
jgi:large subunit ribosomal protein L13